MIPSLPFLAFLKPVGAFLRAIPWHVWLAAAVLFVGWRYGAHQYDAGVADTNAKWEAAQREANTAARDAQDKRDDTAADIATDSDKRAAQQVADTRSTTAAAAERVRYEIRTVEVPAVCDGAVPVGVRDEFSAAVSRANAAGSALRKERDP